MHYSAVVLGFAAAVTAIDLRLYDGNCGGGFYGWTNVQPNVCYAYDRDAHSSAEWRAIPFDWSLNVGAYRQRGCDVLVSSRDVYNQNTVCLTASGRVLTGARYHFKGKKRADDSCDAPGASIETQKKCTEQAGPPTRVGLADGVVYNTAGLETGLVETLIDLAFNGTTAAEVPEVYHNLVVVE
ncbi:hypothetical protein CC86DRAFT_461966 [Ophiobolus disseminans]|uniref:Uncharacterized protein n=1 Tax=Ophiobolus disseminans TaxID=1469910 RepID=A0A6A7AKZ9_9PLEO|nr:hypothetical protein CC86DRAFT_461966 [Ophiobolus disseminans]